MHIILVLTTKACHLEMMSSNQPGAGTSSTSVKVAVRVRPMAAKELLANSKDCVEIIPGTSQIIIGGGPASAVGTETIYNFTQKSFTFDYLFDDNTSQEDLYNLSVAPLVDRFMEGFNATILAYGQVILSSILFPHNYFSDWIRKDLFHGNRTRWYCWSHRSQLQRLVFKR
jgi:hypothetical protein